MHALSPACSQEGGSGLELEGCLPLKQKLEQDWLQTNSFFREFGVLTDLVLLCDEKDIMSPSVLQSVEIVNFGAHIP